MEIIKEEKENSYFLKIKNNLQETFEIAYYAGDLYWTMLDYHKENSFLIEKSTRLYNEMKKIFKDRTK